MTRKLIVFDFDGTLVESQSGFDQALAEFSRSRSLPFDTVKMMHGYVDPFKNDLGWGVPFEQQSDLFEEMCIYTAKQMYDHGRFIPQFFPHTTDVLDQLKTLYDLAIVTARARESTLFILKHHKADEYFPAYRTLCCARERGYPIKPAPDALQCLLSDTRHSPEDVIVIGDTTSDIKMANNAGAKSLAVLWGAHPKEKLEAAEPTALVEEIRFLPKAIYDLFSR